MTHRFGGLAVLRATLVLATVCAALGLGAACGNEGAPDPFLNLAQGGASAAATTGRGGMSAGAAGAGGADVELGGPCTVDAQCDDGIDCTFDRCDPSIGHCRFTPDDTKCPGGSVCEGKPRCDNKQGCVPGEPKTCSMGDPCLIETCDEQTGACKSEKRDADGDGDPDDHCGGGDCNDQDPLVSSKLPEVCNNGIDDNCNGLIDEKPCDLPQHNTCLDPLAISEPGSYAMSTVACSLNYSGQCAVQNAASARDVVAALTLPKGPIDVQLTARDDVGDIAVALVGQCGQPGTEIACSPGFNDPHGGRLAKLRARSLPGGQTLPIYATTDQPTQLTLRVQFLPASQPPPNQTCGTALPIVQATPVTASLVGIAQNLATACAPATGELVYSFSLAEERDVQLFASSLDGDGLPILSLRGAGCALPADEIACAQAPDPGGSAHIVRHSLAAGSYFVAVAATAPTDALVTLQTAAPTPPAPDQTCAGSPVITPGKSTNVDLSNHEDDVDTGCQPGAVDAAYELDLGAPSDVLLVGRYSNGDSAAVELANPPCKSPADLLVCAHGYASPARARLHDVPAGSYRFVALSTLAQPMQLTAFVRPAGPPILVPFANGCADAQKIPAGGGFFEGNTANSAGSLSAGCDQGNSPGGPTQLLELDLAAPKRVALDMQGSGYLTILDLRKGPPCPGAEVAQGCAVGFYPDKSFVDLTLSAGSYYLQIGGFDGQSGPWQLEVFTSDPL